MKKIIGLFLLCLFIFQWDVISQERPASRKKAKSTKTVRSKKNVKSKKSVKGKKSVRGRKTVKSKKSVGSKKNVRTKKSVQRKKSVPRKKTATKTRSPRVQHGSASFYHNKFNGRRTASGEIFSQKKLTCAHNSLPLGTYVKVTNTKNKKAVVLKVNDRLQRRSPRVLDLTRAAATRLGVPPKGLLKVKVEVMAKRK
jgi:rare lipoprotein A